MDTDFIGPFCKNLELEKKHINSLEIKPLKNQHILNGLVLELNAHFKNSSKIVEILLLLNPNLADVHINTLKSRVNRIIDIKKKLISKKKVKGVSSVEDLKNQVFESVTKKLCVTPCKPTTFESIYNETSLISPRQSDVVDTERGDASSQLQIDSSISCHSSYSPNKTELPPPQKKTALSPNTFERNGHETFSKNEVKSLNLYDYEIKRKEKSLQKVLRDIEIAKECLRTTETRIGHFSVRNVNKRDETAKKNLHLLRDAQRQLLRQKKVIEEDAATIRTLNEKIEIMNERKAEEVEIHAKKKLNAQKAASYYKVKASKLRDQLKHDSDEPLQLLRKELTEKVKHISELENNCLYLQDQVNGHQIITKHKDGVFTDNIRLCVIELSGLEVAIEKIPQVMKAVSRHLHGTDLKKSDLPSSTTVQAIVDEGQYIAKTFIAEKLSATQNWGINRDGTTRRKKKILDTSVTLASGDILSLGFTRVAHETAETINNVTKDHVNELALLNSARSDKCPEEYVKESLSKLAFTMSDRASNEKKADKLLDEWRDEVLGSCEDNQRDGVLHFHCMAHVLLGFHRYICKDLKEKEAELVTKHGALGRDGLSVFSFWKTKGTVAERVLLTTSEVFGPSGDHHGVRDLWEAHCAANGIKSVIGNYRDNRFNALFQTSAEIFLHREEFIKVLQTVKAPNLKLRSVLEDLKDNNIMAVIQCLGLIYLKVTGPYWSVITESNVPYLELFHEVNKIQNYLMNITKDPTVILQSKKIWNDVTVTHEKKFNLSLENVSDCETRDLLLETAQLVSIAMCKTMDKQLTDFLEDGQFSQQPNKEDLQRTNFAHTTNLGCEHHFGDLDSSQRRRPSASMHHHTSVQLIKRNRTSLMSWLVDMPKSDQQTLLRSARSGGKELREKHRMQEKNVLKEINTEISQSAKTKNKRKAETDFNSSQKAKNIRKGEDDLLKLLPNSDLAIAENDYVAIAYQDGWYPGVVQSVNEDVMVVNFLVPARKPGFFSWPYREDIQTVDRSFILKSGFIPDCVNSGRMWHISEYKDIEKLYEVYKKRFF